MTILLTAEGVLVDWKPGMKRLFSILGDSISTLPGWNPEGFAVFYTDGRNELAGLHGMEDTWWGKVIAHFDGELLKNGSWSGSMVEGEGCPAGWSPERISALSDGQRVPDDIIVFLGTNDYGWGGAYAQACGRSSSRPACLNLEDYPEAVAGPASADCLNKFMVAYSTMLHNLRDAYPQARIWCCTLAAGRVKGSVHPTHAWNLRGVPMRAYCDAIVQAAKETGCRPVDIAGYGFDYESLEGTHPTELGMSQLADLMIAGMEGAEQPCPTHFLPSCNSASSAFIDWHSKDLCPGKMCVGCPWAKDTGNSWYTVCLNPQFQE